MSIDGAGTAPPDPHAQQAIARPDLREKIREPGGQAGAAPVEKAAKNYQQPAEPPATGVDHWTQKDPTFRITRNRIGLFVDGPRAFPAMEEMLRAAQTSIRIDYFLFSGSEGQRMADILVQKKKAGVDVRVLLDPDEGVFKQFRTSEQQLVAYLQANGVKVQFYPLDRILPDDPKRGEADHNKLMLVDGQQGMVGGMNVADAFLNNHDMMMKIQGPAVTDIKRRFDEVWALVSPGEAPPRDGPEPREQGHAQVRVVGNTVGNRPSGEAVLLDHLRRAQRHIYVEMFELTSPALIDAVLAARQRGVDVRVIADPGEHGRFLHYPIPAGFPNLSALYRLREAGIPVRYYALRDDQVEDHLKLSIIDDAVIAGSQNWSTSGLRFQAETSLEIEDRDTYKAALQLFEDDWQNHTSEVPPPNPLRRAMRLLIDHLAPDY